MNNLALLLYPAGPEVADDVDIVAATVQLNQEGPGEFAELFREMWPDDGERRFIPVVRGPISEFVEDKTGTVVQLADVKDPDQITHLVLLEGNKIDAVKPYFFAGRSITNLGMVLYYSEKTKKFVPLSSQEICKGVLEFIMMNQEVWSAQCKELRQGSRTYN